MRICLNLWSFFDLKFLKYGEELVPKPETTLSPLVSQLKILAILSLQSFHNNNLHSQQFISENNFFFKTKSYKCQIDKMTYDILF